MIDFDQENTDFKKINLKNIYFLLLTLSNIKAKGWIMYGIDSKLKFRDQLKIFRTN